MKPLFKKVVVAILLAEAKLVLRKYKPHIVAVTGSVGKTSAKDAIFAVLAQTEHVRKSDKSFNSEIGLPLTILGCPNGWGNPLRWLENILDGLLLIVFPAKYPKWLVLEVGADKPNDISYLASWLVVDVAVITRLPLVPVHVEFFDSPEDVAKEKLSLIDAVKKGGAVLVYDDDAYKNLLHQKVLARDVRLVTYGTKASASVRLLQESLVFEEEKKGVKLPLGMQAEVSVGESTMPVVVQGVVGNHALLPVLAAIAVGDILGLPKDEVRKGVEAYEPPKGRMRLVRGIKGTCIIDDTYNSSPAAAEAALETLKGLKKGKQKGRRIAVLGDMLELGKFSVEEHKKIGVLAAQSADLLVTVGLRSRGTAESALDAGMPDAAILQYEDSTRAGEELQALVEAGDIILVKGSQSIRTEKIVERLMDEPERAYELLVRQDADWKKR